MTKELLFRDWKDIYPKPFDKFEVSPYTKTRVILMNGNEFEAVFFSHNFSRHCDNNDLRREISIIRRSEQQQQKVIGLLKPANETVLETTISYEQLAVDLTARLAKREKNNFVKQAFDFGLLEDFDHLYRYANLLEMECGIHAEALVGKYTEIMPGRPTISEHRYPIDNIKSFIDYKNSDMLTKLNISILTAAEQQTMNFYMNVAGLYKSDNGRKLYEEIGLIEEQHVSQYGSLMDPNSTWLECLLMHEYTECYLYYSCYVEEENTHIKKVWERHLQEEICHLHEAANLLKKYENKEWQQVIINGEFPEILKLGENLEYVRDILSKTVRNTSIKDEFIDIYDVSDDAMFFMFQNILNHNVSEVPSHRVIDKIITENKKDYRFEVQPNPIEGLRDRQCDNTSLGRNK